MGRISRLKSTAADSARARVGAIDEAAMTIKTAGQQFRRVAFIDGFTPPHHPIRPAPVGTAVVARASRPFLGTSHGQDARATTAITGRMPVPQLVDSISWF